MAIDKEIDLSQRKTKILEDIINNNLINYLTIEQKAIILDLIFNSTDIINRK